MTSYQGIEALLVPWYASQLTGVRVVTETPSDLQSEVPVVRLVAISSVSDVNLPNRLVTIRWVLQCYDNGPQAASELAEQARHATMSALKGAPLVGADVTYVGHESGPSWVAYADTQIRQYVASYSARLTLH